MDYLDGIPATEMKRKVDRKSNYYGTPEQDRHFRKQMAAIQAELSTHVFDKIGNLFYDDKTGFYIGPDLDTGVGPWSSSLKYYQDTVDWIYWLNLETIPREEYLKWRRTSCLLPLAFGKLLPIYSTETTGPFRLTNRDFGDHNVLVNENFDIVCVIDFDGLMAAPIEMVAQFPQGLDWPVPKSFVEKNPMERQREDMKAPQLKEYVEFLKEEENALRQRSPSMLPAEISSHMFSRGASIAQGLNRFGTSGSSNEYADYCNILLREHAISRRRVKNGKERSF